MRQTQGSVKNIREHAHRLGRVGAAERGFGELHVEIGELPPHEALERRDVFAKVIALDEPRAVGDRRFGARQDPARLVTRRIGPVIGGVTAERLRMPLHLREHEAGDVPELVREVSRVQKLRFR